MRRNGKSIALFSWASLIFLIISVIIFLFVKIRPIVAEYAKSKAETALLNFANKAIVTVLKENNITYDNISHISRDASNNITGISVDTVNINLLKSLIADNITTQIGNKDEYKIGIPIGSLIAKDYLYGIGTKIYFNAKFSQSAKIDFENTFESSGINSVLHRIIIRIKLYGSLLTLGKSVSFVTDTSAVAAETVIVGVVPDSFTNVLEEPNSDVADGIFNYAVK